MKIDLSKIDTEHFSIKEGVVGGELCYLVTPKLLNTPWNSENKIFRSSMWNKYGEPVSLSFQKFVNWGEREDLFPVPTSLRDTTAVTKIDGSALIVSKYNGQLITRTRGTFDVSSLLNGDEINILKEKYPKVFDFSSKFSHNESFVYEWVTPTNRIVLDYPEPELYLIGIIKHEDYSLVDQTILNMVAVQLGVKRPESHVFKEIPDMISTIKKWQGLEGICLYSKNGQEIHKIKAEQYLVLHHFKSNATLENTIDLFFEYDCPNYAEFQTKLTALFDFECWNMIRGYASNVIDGYKEVKKIIEGFVKFANQHRHLSRKDFAQKVFASYGDTNRASFVFSILDKGQINRDQEKKLMWQVLKS